MMGGIEGGRRRRRRGMFVNIFRVLLFSFLYLVEKVTRRCRLNGLVDALLFSFGVIRISDRTWKCWSFNTCIEAHKKHKVSSVSDRPLRSVGFFFTISRVGGRISQSRVPSKIEMTPVYLRNRREQGGAISLLSILLLHRLFTKRKIRRFHHFFFRRVDGRHATGNHFGVSLTLSAVQTKGGRKKLHGTHDREGGALFHFRCKKNRFPTRYLCDNGTPKRFRHKKK